ncbi:MAG: diguanylate cyclase [Clostridia bacterium]|jgi:diguanylate cyclase (GGDEF)-like protein/putative nucleotidyltransferase with HDIG domain|nr:diguanylate cyclase [Clostridia bacterium]
MKTPNFIGKGKIPKLFKEYNWNNMEKLAIVFFLVIFPFVFLAGYLTVTTATQTKEELNRKNIQQVKESADQISRNLMEVRLVLETIGISIMVKDFNQGEINRIINQVYQQYNRLDNIFLADLQGNIMGVAPGTLEQYEGIVNVVDREYFQKIIFEKEQVSYQRVFSKLTNRQVLVMAIPVYSMGQELSGVLGAAIILDDLRDEVAKIMKVSNQSGYILLDGYGQVVLDEKEFHFAGDAYGRYALVEKVVMGQVGVEKLFYDFQEMYAYYAPVELGWALAILQPANLVLVNLWQDVKLVLLVFLVILIPVSIFTMVALSSFNYQNIRLKEFNQELEILANTDGLTRVYNHRYLYQMLKKALHSASEQKRALSVIMVDVDNFKLYNDSFGHLEGDELLRSIAQLILSVLPESVALARFGGDEFAIVCPDMNIEETRELAELIRQRVLTAIFNREEELPHGQVTISIGVAAYPDHADTVDQLLKMADIALYKAKAQSKDKVEIYHSVLDELKSELGESEAKLLNTLTTLITIVNAKDSYTYGHSERVMEYSEKIGGFLGLGEERLKLLRYGAFLHDIGKIEIPHHVLNKRTPLSEEEFQLIRQHSEIGAKIVSPISTLQPIVPLIKHHHEHYSGQGYPDGLIGSQIPLFARIVAVADSFDAMTSNRPYSMAMTVEAALMELERCAGTQFDPRLVNTFRQLIELELVVQSAHQAN